jgi:hypothetical protein
MNRNIVTESNAERFRPNVQTVEIVPPSSDVDDFLLEDLKGRSTTRDAVTSGRGKQTIILPAPPPPDRWYERLLKYIPVETIGLYLAVEGIIRSANLTAMELRVYLGLTLIVTLVFTWLYLRQIARVVVVSQIVISCFALVVWVFALGGVFATFSFYKPWQGTAALVIAAAFLGFVPPPEMGKNSQAV